MSNCDVSPSRNYRPEIDGLRALAVLPVVFFHAGFSLFGGGYVGVDIFFVISGYLITRIIYEEILSNNFSLIEFYQRRARRILPALYLVVVLSILIAYWLLPGSGFKSTMQSVVAVSSFLPNVYFSLTSGYFDGASELKPLLHTWSLGVEEQYYAFFPLLLTFFIVKKIRPLYLFGTVFVLSFALCVYFGTHNPQFNFYSLPTRSWELMLGAFAALLEYRKQQCSNNYRNNIVSLFGLVLIGLSVFVLDSNTSFPGWWALLPTCGAFLVIAYGKDKTFVANLLSHPLLVGIGLISYSIYLFHHPVFSFLRWYYIVVDGSKYIVAIVLIILLAFLSWRFVEKPFRNKRFVSDKLAFFYAFIGGVGILLIGVLGHYNIIHSRADTLAFESNYLKWNDDLNPCHLREGQWRELNNTECKLGDPNSMPTIALIGDSHAHSFRSELDIILKREHLAGIQLTYTACPPVRDIYFPHKPVNHKCKEWNYYVFNYLKSHPEIQYVLLSSRWTAYLEGELFDNNEGGREARINLAAYPISNGIDLDSVNRKEKVAALYTRAIDDYLKAGKKVILIYPIPEAGFNLAVDIFKPEFKSNDTDLSTSYNLFEHRNEASIHALDSVGMSPSLWRIRPERIFCNSFREGRCVTQLNGIPLYFDTNHVNGVGAHLLLQDITSILNSKEKNADKIL